MLVAIYVPPGDVDDGVAAVMRDLEAAVREGSLPADQTLGHEVLRITRERIRRIVLSPEFDPERLVHHADGGRAVAEILHRMDAPDREILRRTCVEGSTPEEIAESDGCTVDEVCQRKKHALDQFLLIYSRLDHLRPL